MYILYFCVCIYIYIYVYVLLFLPTELGSNFRESSIAVFGAIRRFTTQLSQESLAADEKVPSLSFFGIWDC